jgi:hypothetical protein
MLAACAATAQLPATNSAHAAFDAERWEQAAVELAELSESPSEVTEARQIAEHRMGVSLYRLGLRAAAASIFEAIARSPKHGAREQAMRSLLPLAVELPSAAAVEAPLVRYDDGSREDALDGPAAVVNRVRFLLGRFDYEARDYPRAIAQLEKIYREDYVRARILIAMCHVNMRKSVPAVKALDEALRATPKLPEAEARRFTDLAHMLMAQIFYSAAHRMKEDGRTILLDRAKARAALKYWGKIDVSSPLATEAQWQRAWVELALGDQAAALSDARAARATPGAYVPEAALLEATVRWGMGETEAAMELFRGFVTRYSAVHKALTKLVAEPGKEAEPDAAAFALLARANQHPEEIPEEIRPAVTHALGDRRVLEDLEYSRLLDKEQSHLDSMPALGASKAGARARDALAEERRGLIRSSAEMVRARLGRQAEELQTLLKVADEALATRAP